MMILYDKLYRTAGANQGLASYISPLIDEIVANFPNSSLVKLEKEIEDVVLDIKTLQPLGIIINELITNIMKYAFVGRNNGLIRIQVKSKGKKITFSIEDDGNCMPDTVDFENSNGFGLKLVSMLVTQIDGKISIIRDNGTKIILVLINDKTPV
jgi:two-component sensor histidine kinase